MEDMVPKQRPLHLTPEQRACLEDSLRHDHRAYIREQAAALLKITDGMTANAVALHGLLRRRKPATVRGWRDHYEKYGKLHVRPPCRGFSPQRP
jgi:hypothetical protein